MSGSRRSEQLTNDRVASVSDSGRNGGRCGDGLICSLTPQDYKDASQKDIVLRQRQQFDGALMFADYKLPDTKIASQKNNPYSDALSNFWDMPMQQQPKHREGQQRYPGGHDGRQPLRPPESIPPGSSSEVWNGVQHNGSSVKLSFRGCAVDTDGSGAYRHPEDRTRQSQTSLRRANGESLDTDKDNFFVLSKSMAKAYGIKKGDLGWLVQKDTGKAVPVIFGDVGPEGKLGEASVKALKDLGYSHVNGARGVAKDQKFDIVFVPGSGNGKGNIARDTHAMARRLAEMGVPGWQPEGH